MSNLDLIRNKRHQFDNLLNFSSFSRKKRRSSVINSANLYIKPLGLPFISTTTSSSSELIRLEPYCPHTIGRAGQRCDSVFEDSRVSKTHCQVLFDAFNRKLILADGVLWSGSSECSRVRVSLNGVFVNGARIGRAEVVELDAGDEVSLVCANEGDCSLGVRIGFLVQKIVFVEEVCERNVSSFGANCRCSGYPVSGSQCSRDSVKVNFLLSQCRQILHSNDPIYCIRKSIISSNGLSSVLSNVKFPVEGALEPGNGAIVEMRVNQRLELGNANMVELGSIIHQREKSLPFKVNAAFACDNCDDNHIQRLQYGYPLANNVTNGKSEMMEMDSRVKEIASRFCGAVNDVNEGVSIPPPGRKFYLNRLQSMGNGGQHAVVSLPELFYPVGSLKQVFIATFTSDIPWFLAYCEIPVHLPVTITCHNREKCWSSSPDERIVMPCSDFPNLIVVYPPFPEVIAFGNDRKKSGIACHHPKLFVLQREDSIRIVITSANLVAKQWNSVTNTVWWQDFPRASIPDYLSLFTQLSMGNINQDIQSDFAAQLAGFMASLIADVPSQAHWILELTKYDFKGAVGHLVASVPGIHSRRTPPIFVSMYLSPCASRAEIVKVLGSIETSVVGLSHLFRSSADSSGAQLKKLASFIGKCQENSNGMLEVVLRRNTNIPADVNAVSILVPNPKQFLVEDCVQLGFLPRAVAKWVAPLLDSGLFRFSGFVYPKEVLAAALEGSSSKVQMILYVSQGPSFSDLSKVDHAGHFSPICSLIASIQRSTGIWRLHEVLSHYKWPEYLETDFLFGSSSIGAVNAQFLAAFSAAAGKTSVQLSESEESDPDWGCWTASQELRNPSIRIIFPTIERVKNASCGILASKHILCFSQKTWQRLRNVGIVLDAIPYPSDRVNDPMHVKVARRRFQAKTDASSFGWVYCGSHNFSASAWGRPLFKPSGMMDDKAVKTNSILGSRLHICNYEVGIIFVVPPSDSKNMSLDDIVLPFVVPAPKYRPCDQPATPQAMREVCLELREQERIALMDEAVAGELMEEERLEEEEEVLEATNYVAEEQEDEKAYAEALWSQVDSSES